MFLDGGAKIGALRIFLTNNSEDFNMLLSSIRNEIQDLAYDDLVLSTKEQFNGRASFAFRIGARLCRIRDDYEERWQAEGFESAQAFVWDRIGITSTQYRKWTRLWDMLEAKNIPPEVLALFTNSQLEMLGPHRKFTAKTAPQWAKDCKKLTNRELAAMLHPKPDAPPQTALFTLPCTKSQKVEWNDALAEYAENESVSKADAMDAATSRLASGKGADPEFYLDLAKAVAQDVLTNPAQRRQFMVALEHAFTAAAANSNDDQPGTVQ